MAIHGFMRIFIFKKKLLPRPLELPGLQSAGYASLVWVTAKVKLNLTPANVLSIPMENVTQS